MRLVREHARGRIIVYGTCADSVPGSSHEGLARGGELLDAGSR